MPIATKISLLQKMHGLCTHAVTLCRVIHVHPSRRERAIRLAMVIKAIDMKQSVAEDVPSHLRRTGRIESLAEFQQRVRIQSSASVEGPSSESLPDNVQIVSDNVHDSCMYIRRQSTASSFGPVTSNPTNKTVLRSRQYKILFFLFILGIIGVPVIYSMKRLDAIILARRMKYIDRLQDGGSEYVAWIIHAIFFTVVGLLLTQISSAAAGSGVSQMKTILTGIDPSFYLPGYFDASTLFAKMGGLVCAVGAGLVVGTEGANVHIMSIITHHLLRLGIFQNLGERLNMRLQFLAAACAVGVAATFSSPIGGVLFSMEVTSTYYLISNYLKAFISSVSGALVLKILLTLTSADSKEANSSILLTSFPPQPYTIKEIPLYILLGVCIGVLATGMLWLVRVIAIKRTSLRQSKLLWSQVFIRWIDPLLVAVLCASATYLPGKFTQIGRMSEIVILFTPTDLPESWLLVSEYYACAVVCTIYVVLLPLCITLKLPTGIWLPTFIAGAAFGRFFGEFVKSLFPRIGVIPGTYSLAGAAAFGGARDAINAAYILCCSRIYRGRTRARRTLSL
uniref:Chloride Channel (ClC) Family putative n=1 Tax=Albugo laibachii Nc14 TaxID=890382 RepID=F0WPF6_9STRA|nr:Chloride Channel (ClC) Family putative [Albugo laibachii Nc14]|eukprot:CCA23204.1 Chloride Channel (ClC) Family putative [Albugo laibachii Nc14]